MKSVKILSILTLSLISFNLFAAEVICGQGPNAINEINSQLASKKDITITAPVSTRNASGVDSLYVCVSVNQK